MSQARVGAELRDVAGVADVRANTLTGTVLVRYDPERTGVAQIRARLERPPRPLADGRGRSGPASTVDSSRWSAFRRPLIQAALVLGSPAERIPTGK